MNHRSFTTFRMTRKDVSAVSAIKRMIPAQGKISPIEEAILTCLRTLLVVFLYLVFREGWVGGYIDSLSGLRKHIFIGFMAIVFIVGSLSIPIQVRVKRSNGRLVYKSHALWILAAALVLIIVFEWLVI